MAAHAHEPYLFDDDIADVEPTQPLVGIAKLAAAGESVRVGHNVEYFSFEAKSILNRCDAPRMPFRWTINPYRGCEFACKYCYARYTHEFMEVRDPVEFERRIYVKDTGPAETRGETPGANLRWLLRHDLKKVKPGEEIAIGTATDPYQPAERRYAVTRSLLDEFAEHSGLALSIVTKSDLVVRDIDLLREIAERNRLFVNLTITTLDTQLARILEPRAPRPDLRLQALRELNAAGIDAGVICAPVVPGITDSPKALEALVAATAAVKGKYIFANALHLRPCSAAVFLPFLEAEFPDLVQDYRKRYAGRAFTGQAYRRRLSDLMAKLRRKYGIRYDFKSMKKAPATAQPEQMDLFFELTS